MNTSLSSAFTDQTSEGKKAYNRSATLTYPSPEEASIPPFSSEIYESTPALYIPSSEDPPLPPGGFTSSLVVSDASQGYTREEVNDSITVDDGGGRTGWYNKYGGYLDDERDNTQCSWDLGGKETHISWRKKKRGWDWVNENISGGNEPGGRGRTEERLISIQRFPPLKPMESKTTDTEPTTRPRSVTKAKADMTKTETATQPPSILRSTYITPPKPTHSTSTEPKSAQPESPPPKLTKLKSERHTKPSIDTTILEIPANAKYTTVPLGPEGPTSEMCDSIISERKRLRSLPDQKGRSKMQPVTWGSQVRAYESSLSASTSPLERRAFIDGIRSRRADRKSAAESLAGPS